MKWLQVSDQIQLTLVQMILLLSTEDAENLTLEQKSRIEQSQLKYIIMLHRYLKSFYRTEANSKFAGSLMVLQYAKELYKLHSLRLPFWILWGYNSYEVPKRTHNIDNV